jgi:hypothetical protein
VVKSGNKEKEINCTKPEILLTVSTALASKFTT